MPPHVRLVLVLGIVAGAVATAASLISSATYADEKIAAPGVTVTTRGAPAAFLLSADAPPGHEQDAEEARDWMLEFSEFEDQTMLGPVAPGWLLFDWILWSIPATLVSIVAVGIWGTFRRRVREGT